MDKFDKEVTDFLIYNEVMKNNNSSGNKSYGSSSTGCSRPFIVLLIIIIALSVFSSIGSCSKKKH